MTIILASTSSRSPIGTVLTHGSSALSMTEREGQVADLIIVGYSHKKIGSTLGISPMNVANIASTIASRIPGEGSPKLKIAAWMWTYGHEYPDTQ